MTRALADDWKFRLGVVCQSIVDIRNMTDAECRKLVQVAFGNVDRLPSDGLTYDDVRKCFPPHVLRKYRSIAGSSLPSQPTSFSWFAYKKCTDQQHVSSIQRVLQFLRLIIPHRGSGGSPTAIGSFMMGVLSEVKEMDGRVRRNRNGKASKRKTIECGNIIQVLLHSERVENDASGAVRLLVPSTSTGCRTFWYVQGLYADRTGHPLYAHILRMRPVHNTSHFENQLTLDTADSTLFIVKLSSDMRACLALHDCVGTSDGTCVSNGGDQGFRHLNSTAEGVWTVLGSKEGFPPRSS